MNGKVENRSLTTFFSFFLITLLFQFSTTVEAANNSPKLFDILQTSGNNGATTSAMTPVGGNIPVAVNFAAFSPDTTNPPNSLEATFEGKVYTLVKEKIEKRAEGNYTWFGSVDGVAGSSAILTVVDGYLRGRIDIGKDGYALAPVDGQYVITKEDHARAIKFGDDVLKVKASAAAQLPKISSATPSIAGADTGSTIDVLVVYTDALYTKYGSSLASMIQNYVDISNAAYTRSGIDTQIRLVHSEQYTNSSSVVSSTTSISNALTYITSSDTALATLRSTYKADLVSLLRIYDGAGGACGLAYIGSAQYDYSSYAFSVVDVLPSSEASGGYYCYDTTFTHELGHNMGCAHDRANSTSSGAYSYSYGYGISGTFGTIMSYLSPVINYFSTPNITYQGNAIGTSTDDNVTTINNMKLTIASYQQSGGSTTTTLSAPTNFTATASGSSVTISWTAASGASGYKVYYGTTSGTYLNASTGANLGNRTSFTFTNIPAGTYYLALKAYDSSSTLSSYSSEVSVTVTSTTLSAPTNFSASASGSTVTVSWTAASGASGYKLYYGTTSGTYLNASSGVNLGNRTSYTFTNIPSGTYYLALKSYDSSSSLSSYSTETSVTVSASSSVCASTSGCYSSAVYSGYYYCSDSSSTLQYFSNSSCSGTSYCSSTQMAASTCSF
ncbi:MAG: hypothetical protein HQK84_09550 [Nitrospinae bacterium]|nr:hypothetical protein [Nitrospinota bacterium]